MTEKFSQGKTNPLADAPPPTRDRKQKQPPKPQTVSIATIRQVDCGPASWQYSDLPGFCDILHTTDRPMGHNLTG